MNESLEEFRARTGARIGPETGAFHQLVGYRIVIRDDGTPTVELDLSADKHLNQYGGAHGGVALTLLDTVGGVAVYATGDPFDRIATISLSSNFLDAPTPGLVTARATIDRIGGSVAYTTMWLHQGDLDGPVMATGQGAYRLFRSRKG